MAAGGTSRNTLTDGGHHSYQQKSMTPGSGEGKPVEETWFCAEKSESFPRVFSFRNENVTLNLGCPNTLKELYALKQNIYIKERSKYRRGLSKNVGGSLMMTIIIMNSFIHLPFAQIAAYNS